MIVVAPNTNFEHEPEVVQNYLKFASIMQGFSATGKIDLTHLVWVYPTTLLPICCLVRERNLQACVLEPALRRTASYVKVMTSNRIGCSFVPLFELPLNQAESKTPLEEIVKKWQVVGGTDTFAEVLSELVDNIYTHSRFKNAFVMVQSYPRKGFLELCFCDNGISIPGSFKEKSRAGSSDVETINMAIRGVSTKAYAGERGHGLSTSLNILANGLHGNAVVVSGCGAVYVDGGTTKGFNLSPPNNFNGTLIGARVPFPTQKVDVYDFIK